MLPGGVQTEPNEAEREPTREHPASGNQLRSEAAVQRAAVLKQLPGYDADYLNRLSGIPEVPESR